MKKFRFIFFSLVALAFVVGAIVAIRSQKDDANLLARHLGNWTNGFDVLVNEQTKGTSASFTDYPVQLFPSLESPSKKAEIDTVLVEGIPTAENHNIARRWNKALSLLPENQRYPGFSGKHFDLRNEGKHTVLHLYIYAPADKDERVNPARWHRTSLWNRGQLCRRHGRAWNNHCYRQNKAVSLYPAD